MASLSVVGIVPIGEMTGDVNLVIAYAFTAVVRDETQFWRDEQELRRLLRETEII